MDPVIKVESITKWFGDVVAVNDVSFEIFRGEVFGFLGPNGAGKTTTIKIMSGLLDPDSGNVKILANDHPGSIGICPQNIVVWDNLTCLEQVIFLGQMYNLPQKRSREKALLLLDSLGLTSVKDRLAKRLSGGMQRRLNIALAFIHSPEIVFLDEPQAGLDPQSRVLVRDYIRSVRDNTTIVLTTHDMEEAEKLSDRICIIDSGKILVSGTAEEIKAATGNEDIIEAEIEGDTFLELVDLLPEEFVTKRSSSGNMAILCITNPVMVFERILGIVKERSLRVRTLRMRKKSLEDVFINLTGRSIRE